MQKPNGRSLPSLSLRIDIDTAGLKMAFSFR